MTQGALTLEWLLTDAWRVISHIGWRRPADLEQALLFDLLVLTIAVQKHLYLYSQCKCSWEWGATKIILESGTKSFANPNLSWFVSRCTQWSNGAGYTITRRMPLWDFSARPFSVPWCFLMMAVAMTAITKSSMPLAPPSSALHAWRRTLAAMEVFPYFLWNLKCKPLSW